MAPNDFNLLKACPTTKYLSHINRSAFITFILQFHYFFTFPSLSYYETPKWLCFWPTSGTANIQIHSIILSMHSANFQIDLLQLTKWSKQHNDLIPQSRVIRRRSRKATNVHKLWKITIFFMKEVIHSKSKPIGKINCKKGSTTW